MALVLDGASMIALIDALSAISLWCALFMAGLTDIEKSREL